MNTMNPPPSVKRDSRRAVPPPQTRRAAGLLLAGVLGSLAAPPARTETPDTQLMEQSIRATKQSIARDTLDVFYRDAVDFYHANRLDESLELLNKIHSIDPYYANVQALRQTIFRLKASQDSRSKRGVVEELMSKGHKAERDGKLALAVSFWKQALAVDPRYKPAQEKIDAAHRALAQKQYEQGYLHYHHGDMEEALDCWSNTIALDPSYKKRGLLTLMSKVELAARRERATRLAAQAYAQYEQNNLEGSLQSYQELLQLEPRHEEARRMSAKIKIQLGQAAYKAGRDALSQRLYAEAIKNFEKALSYDFESGNAKKGIEEAERQMRLAALPKPKPKPKPAAAEPSEAAPPAAPPAPPAPPARPEEALAHYRQGLAAFKSQDFHRALNELRIANQLDPSNEHIYISLKRAEQEWSAASSRPANAP